MGLDTTDQFLSGICLDILQNRWSPTYDVSAILTSIQSLLDEPNPNSPANSVAAQLYQVFPFSLQVLGPKRASLWLLAPTWIELPVEEPRKLN